MRSSVGASQHTRAAVGTPVLCFPLCLGDGGAGSGRGVRPSCRGVWGGAQAWALLSAAGFAGVDHCLLNDHGCQHACISTDTSFVCQCPEGHRLRGDGKTCASECSGAGDMRGLALPAVWGPGTQLCRRPARAPSLDHTHPGDTTRSPPGQLGAICPWPRTCFVWVQGVPRCRAGGLRSLGAGVASVRSGGQNQGLRSAELVVRALAGCGALGGRCAFGAVVQETGLMGGKWAASWAGSLAGWGVAPQPGSLSD